MTDERPYEEHAPSPALARVIDRVWTKRTRGGHATKSAVIVPDGCVDVLFHLGTDARAVVVGAMTKPNVVPTSPLDVVAVRFRPGEAARFFDVPIDTLTDAHVELQHVAVDATATLDALAAGERTADRVRAVEALVAARVSRRPRSERWTSRAITRLVSPSPPAIAALAAELGVTRQHLCRRMTAVVGVGPKELARIARAQRVLADLAAGSRGHADIAAAHGLFDQSHMIRELRALTGLSPSALVAGAGDISPITSAYEVR